MSYYISLNKLELNEFNVNAADAVRQTIDSDFDNRRTLDEICGSFFYDPNVPYFICTNTQTKEKSPMTTFQLAELYENFELIDMVETMGKPRTEPRAKSIELNAN